LVSSGSSIYPLLLFEYVALLGLIDVAYLHPNDGILSLRSNDYYESTLSRYDGLYFRLTPLGAYCLGLSDRYQPAALPKTGLTDFAKLRSGGSK